MVVRGRYTVDGEVKFGLFRCIMACAAKNKERVEIQDVSACTFGTSLYKDL